MQISEIRRKRLKEFMEDAGVDVKELAQRIGANESYVYSLLSEPDKPNHRNIGAGTLKKLATALTKLESDFDSFDGQTTQSIPSLRPEVALRMPLIKSIIEFANAEDWETVALLAGQLYKRLRHEEGEKKQDEKERSNISTG